MHNDMHKLLEKVREILAFPFTKPLSWPAALLVVIVVIVIIALILPSCSSS